MTTHFNKTRGSNVRSKLRLHVERQLGLALGLSLLASTASAQPVLTKENGSPVTNNERSETVGGYGGPVVLQDFHLIEKLARFDRERIPERVVHARGVGAFGDFVSSGEAAKYTSAALFSKSGVKTPIFLRFSTVIHPSGSPETLRDPRGFAVKFYTSEGNWDLVGNNLDVFFIRDAMKFPDMVHSLKPSPVTNQQDPGRFFDFFSHHPESTNMLTTLYSDLGTPANYRQMDGSSVHALKLVNAKGEAFYAKFTWKSKNGVKSLATPAEWEAVQAKAFSHATEDLYESIAKRQFPQWELRAQIIPVSKVDAFRFNPLDPTKRWPENEVPSVSFGTLTLNKTPDNFFQTTEQSAFSPGVMVPGIFASEDKLLQGRLFSYADTQRYRIGANYQQLPVNTPKVAVVSNIQDGAMSFVPRTGDVNYAQSETTPRSVATRLVKPPEPDLARLGRAFAKEDDFYQAGEFYRGLSEEAKTRLVNNFAGDLKKVKDTKVKQTWVGYLSKADADYGRRVGALVGVKVAAVAPVALPTKALSAIDAGVALRDFAREGDVAAARALLDAGADINTADAKGYSPLILAAYNGQPAMVSLLLSRGAKVNAGDARGNTALMGAIFRGHREVVDLLLAAPGHDINNVNGSGQTALMFAHIAGRSEIAKLLIAKGARTDIVDAQGLTAAQWGGTQTLGTR